MYNTYIKTAALQLRAGAGQSVQPQLPGKSRVGCGWAAQVDSCLPSVAIWAQIHL